MTIIIIVCGAAAAFLLLTALWDPLQQQLLQRYTLAQGAADDALRAASIYTMSAARLVQLQLIFSVTALVLALVMSSNIIVSVLAAAFASFLPRWWVAQRQLRRLQRLEEVLPAALDQMTGSVRAGLSLAQALEEVANSGPAPAHEEFAIIVKEHKLGARLIDSIEAARLRIGGRFFPLLATALRISVERGGNLPEAIQRMAESFREIWRLEQKVITASAEARKAMRVIGAMPLVVALLTLVMQPDLIDTLTGSLVGWIVLAAVVALYSIGLLWLQRLLRLEA